MNKRVNVKESEELRTKNWERRTEKDEKIKRLKNSEYSATAYRSATAFVLRSTKFRNFRVEYKKQERRF